MGLLRLLLTVVIDERAEFHSRRVGVPARTSTIKLVRARGVNLVLKVCVLVFVMRPLIYRGFEIIIDSAILR